MVDIINLENGISVVMEQMQSMRSVAFGIFIKSGSINEDDKTNGISHFIEHMLFKGTKNRTAKQIAEEMDNIGGQLNAYTSKEYTCYYARVLDTHIDTAIDVLSDMLFNSSFDEQEIKKESKVILEEISMYEDSPEDIVFSSIQKKVWAGSPLERSVLGSKENVSSFKKEDFESYLDENYIGENTVIAIAGSFDKTKILNLIKQNFSKMKKGEKTKTEDTKVYIPSKIKTNKDIEQLHMCLSFDGIGMKDKYNYSTSLLNAILGGGMSSILFQKIREENGLAYTIYSYNSSYTESGLFNIYAGLNKTQLNKTINIIKQELTLLKQNKITKEQIDKTKEQLKSGYIMGLESTSNRMSSIGRSKLLLGKIKTPDEIIQEVDKITKSDIDTVIDRIFDLDKMSISIVGRTEGISI